MCHCVAASREAAGNWAEIWDIGHPLLQEYVYKRDQSYFFEVACRSRIVQILIGTQTRSPDETPREDTRETVAGIWRVSPDRLSLASTVCSLDINVVCRHNTLTHWATGPHINNISISGNVSQSTTNLYLCTV